MRWKATLGMAVVLLAGLPGAAAVAETPSTVVTHQETVCSSPRGRADPSGVVTQQVSGSLPTTGAGTFFLPTGGEPGSGSIVLRESLGADARVLACADVPADWAGEEPIEVDLVPEPGSPVAGRARFGMVADADFGPPRLELAIVTWPAAGWAMGDDAETCRSLGGRDAVLEALAVLGLPNRWSTVTPHGIPITLAWSDDHWIVGRVVGDDPVRQVAVEALFERADPPTRGRWTTEELERGLAVLGALQARWFDPGPFGPDAWPSLVTVDTQATDGQYGLTIEDDGIHIEFWIEPKPVKRSRADSCELL